MAVPTILLADFKAGRHSNTFRVRMFRFWERRTHDLSVSWVSHAPQVISVSYNSFFLLSLLFLIQIGKLISFCSWPIRVNDDSRFWSDLLLLIAFSSKLIRSVIIWIVFSSHGSYFFMKTSMSIKILWIRSLFLRFFGLLRNNLSWFFCVELL